MKKKLELIVEIGEDNHLWGWIEKKSSVLLTGQGETLKLLIENIKEGMAGYIRHEGKDDKFWSKIDVDTVEFEIKYDLATFFEQFDELNITAIAARAGINPSLLRQYKSGHKYPSAEQVKKIEDAIHALGKELIKINLIAA